MIRDWIPWIIIGLIVIFLIWLFFGGNKPVPMSFPVKRKKPVISELEDELEELEAEEEAEVEAEDEVVEEVEEIKPIPKDRRSKGEIICCQTLEEIYGKPFKSVRPDFLKNPTTGHNLELDCYNEELKLAVEYNGEQHYVWPNFFRTTQQQFVEQLRRDQFKVEMCDQLGIYLITVPYTVSHELIPAYIRHYLPEAVMSRLTDN